MSVQIRKMSPLRMATLRSVGGVEFFDRPEYPVIEEASDDVVYEVQDGDQIDTLAEQFYGDRSLWRLLAVANGLELLPSDLKIGMKLVVPSNGRMLTEIMRVK